MLKLEIGIIFNLEKLEMRRFFTTILGFMILAACEDEMWSSRESEASLKSDSTEITVEIVEIPEHI
jgi:hypothetical protein